MNPIPSPSVIPESPPPQSRSPPESNSGTECGNTGPRRRGMPGKPWVAPSLKEIAGLMVWDSLPVEYPSPVSPGARSRLRFLALRMRRTTIAKAQRLADGRMRELAESARRDLASFGGSGFDG